MLNKPFAEAAHQNRDDILNVLREAFADVSRVLEIGSGTGQHAVYFAEHLDYLLWQTSDKTHMLEGIQLWINHATLANTPDPITLDVNSAWPTEKYDAVFAANIIHIMHWPEIESLFKGVSATLCKGGIVCLYGPFNIDNCYTSESNERFDQWLKQRDPQSGLRDKEALDTLAINNDLHPHKNWQMPANNKMLSWKK